MKKVLKSFVVLFSMMAIDSCGDDATEFLTVDEYILQNNLTVQTTATGIKYIIHVPGTAPNPTASSSVSVDYTGYFLGGGNFDAGNGVSFPLSGVIAGWTEGLQLIGTGGSITLLIPSNLAYGSSGNGNIPGGTDLGFDVDLISIQ